MHIMQSKQLKDSKHCSEASSEDEADTALSSHRAPNAVKSFGTIEAQSKKKAGLFPQYAEMHKFIEQMKKDFKTNGSFFIRELVAE